MGRCVLVPRAGRAELVPASPTHLPPRLRVLCSQTPLLLHSTLVGVPVQVSDKLYTSIVKTCGMEQLERGVTDPACKQLVDKMETAIGGFYGYNL